MAVPKGVVPVSDPNNHVDEPKRREHIDEGCPCLSLQELCQSHALGLGDGELAVELGHLTEMDAT